MPVKKKVTETTVTTRDFALPRQTYGRFFITYEDHKLWELNKNDFFQKYFFSNRLGKDPYKEFGFKVEEAISFDDTSNFSKAEVKTLKKVTRFPEYKKRVDLDFGAFFVMCFIDGCDKQMTEIVEYEIGDSFNKSYFKSDSYDKVNICAGAIQQETGIYPKSAHVELIQRVGNPYKGEKFKVGDEVIRIKKPITLSRVEKSCKGVLKSAKEISYHYNILLKLKTIMIPVVKNPDLFTFD